MRISRVYTSSPLQTGQVIKLDDKASHYLGKVLRLPLHAELILFNGDGKQYPAAITAIEKKSISVLITDELDVDNESPLHIHLGIAMSKGDRMDWIVQKATELGAAEITPLTSERCEVKIKGDRLEKKLQHWRQIAISSCEQCGRNQLLRINTLQGIESWSETVNAERKFILHHRSAQTLSSHDEVRSVALLIGPEGGLSAREIAESQTKGFDPLRLGPRVLRTETAPLAAITALQYVWGDI